MDSKADDVARILATLDKMPAPARRLVLIAMTGLPGSGKSTVAEAIHRRFGLPVLRSDAVRKQLYAHPAYTQEESARVFRALHAAAAHLLRTGCPVVLDATLLDENARAPVRELARECATPLVFVRVTAPDRIIRDRLTQRSAGQRAAFDQSDADIAIYEMMREKVEPLRDFHLTVRSDRALEPQIERLARYVEEP